MTIMTELYVMLRTAMKLFVMPMIVGTKVKDVMIMAMIMLAVPSIIIIIAMTLIVVISLVLSDWRETMSRDVNKKENKYDKYASRFCGRKRNFTVFYSLMSWQ